MAVTNGRVRRGSGLHRQRRIIVLAVPPVEELDLVGPIQVLSSANRLAGEAIYSVEVVTNRNDLKVEGEAGLLSFLAQGHYKALKGSFHSLLVVCGVATRSARDTELFAWMRTVAPRVRRLGSVLRWLISSGRGWSAQRQTGDCALEIRPGIGAALPQGQGRIRADMGKGWQHLHLRRHLGGHRLGTCLGGGGLRQRNRQRSSS